jgi:hypothetical protein
MVAKMVPEIAQRQDGEFLLASVANLRLQAAGAGALAEENKKLREELDGYRKKAQPLKQDTTPKKDAPGGKDSPDDILSAGLNALAPRIRAIR